VNNPWPLFGIMLGYSACLLPTLTLTNVVAMRNLPDPARGFARVRLVGTFGWIVAGYVVAWAIVPMSPQPFVLAAGVAVVQGVSSFWLPRTPPMGRGRPVRDLIGLSALAMFRDRAFVGFAVAALIGNMLNQFYVLNANRYLAASGLTHSEAWLTLAQWCEMGCMAAVPFLVGRFGLRPVMLAGLAGWVVRNAVLAAGSVPVAVAVAVPLHGLSYTFFSVVGALFVDREAPPHLRASAQALVTFLSSGPAVLAGYWLASAAGRHFTTPAGIDWAGVWIVPTAGCLVAFAAFLALFREPPAGRSGGGPG
jgi:nucleoside transporter